MQGESRICMERQLRDVHGHGPPNRQPWTHEAMDHAATIEWTRATQQAALDFYPQELGSLSKFVVHHSHFPTPFSLAHNS